MIWCTWILFYTKGHENVVPVSLRLSALSLSLYVTLSACFSLVYGPRGTLGDLGKGRGGSGGAEGEKARRAWRPSGHDYHHERDTKARAH